MNKGLDILKSFNKHIKFINIAVWTDKLFCSIIAIIRQHDGKTKFRHFVTCQPSDIWHFHSILHLSNVKSPWLLIIKGYNIKQNGPNLPFFKDMYPF